MSILPKESDLYTSGDVKELVKIQLADGNIDMLVASNNDYMQV
ncbi:MAG: hypothetical protein AAF223_13580 [Bacteroidota bacterium]